MKDRIRICIKEGEDSYKVTSIYLLGDGSFKIDVPYCSHEEGLVVKLSLPENVYSKKGTVVNEERESFLVKNRPQLSIHASGFVQFSGKGILSGIDKNTNQAKGLAVNSNPLTTPVKSGPTCSILFWGLEKGYQKVSKTELINYFIPGSAFHPRIFNEKEKVNTCQLEIFVFPGTKELLDSIKTDLGGKEFIALTFCNYLLAPGTTLILGVIRLKNINSFLGILPSRVYTIQATQSDFGFCLSSPTQKKKEGGWHALQAFSPVPNNPGCFKGEVLTYMDHNNEGA